MTLTSQQIERGFWYYDQSSPWQPNSTVFPRDYNESPKLSVACTQGVATVSPSGQAKLVKEWFKFLPTLENVKYIWFTTQINQPLFDAVCEMPNLEGFYIKWSSIKDIGRIGNLSNLKHLHIGSSTQIKDISPLSQMTNLVTLELENIKVMQDISPICKLENLQGLGIDGAIWTNQKIGTLEPIKNLQKLKYLSLTGTKVLDKSLKPVGSIKSLERIWIAAWYPKSEFEYLYNNLPNLKWGTVIQVMTDAEFCEKMKIK